MTRHKTQLECPRCEGDLSLTTEWGWIDNQTCTATVCCPECRTDTGWSDDAVMVCHAPSEKEALAGVSEFDLVSQIRKEMECESA